MSANYREPQFLLPNCKNLKLPGTGTSVGSGLTEDRHSLYSMDFDGNNDYIDTGDAFTSLTSFSISAWFKSDDTSTAAQAIVSSRINSIGTSQGLDLNISGDVLFARIYNNGATQVTTAFTDTASWHHVAMIYNGTTLELFLDNVSQGTATGVYTNSAANWIIGKWNAGANYFNGKIDEVAIFSRALSSDEVTTLYNSGSPSNPMLLSGKPVAYYPLGEQARKPGTANWRFPNEVLQGQAINFDGTDYIESNLDLSGSSAFTASAWVKRDQNQLGYIVSQWGEGAASTSTWGISCGPASQLYFFVRSGSSTPLTQATITNNEWTHVMGVWTGSQIQLYVNGDLQDTVSASSINNSTREFKIGVDDLNTYYFDGKISNVAIWDTDQSVNKDNIYNNGAPQTSYTVTPKAWYKLDKTSKFTGLNPNWHSALNFNGSSRISAPLNNVFNSATESTISFWAKKSSSSHEIVLGAGTAETNSIYILWYSNSYVYFGTRATGATGFNINYLFSGSDKLNKWHHFVGVYNAGTASLYINGSLVVGPTSGGPSALGNNIDSTFAIGRLGDVTTYNSTGEMSNVAIYNQVISPEDIKYLYNGGTPQTNISFEPVSWWKLDNTGTGIQDSGSASNDGTNNGASPVTDSVAVDEWVFENTVQSQTPNWSSSLIFNQNTTGNRVQIPHSTSLDITSNLSVSFWYKQNGATGDASAVSKDAFGSARSWFMWVNNFGSSNLPVVGVFDSSNNPYSVYGTIRVDDRNWHNIVMTYEPSVAVRLYIDGKLNNSNTTNIPSSIASEPTVPIVIGESYTSTSYPIKGFVNNVAIFNTTLDLTAITALYNNGQPEATISSSPVSWWKLDNTTTGIQDAIGSNNGTNNGATEIQTNVWTPRLNGESDTLPSTALVSSDLQFNSAYSSFSLDFDGTGDNVNCTDISYFSGADRFSLSTWFKVNSTDDGSANRDIISKGTTTAGTTSFLLRKQKNSNGNKVQIAFDEGVTNFYSTTQIQNDIWYHVVIVYKGYESNNTDRLNIYVNGVDVTASYTNTVPTTLISSTQPFRIGRWAGSATDFNGNIDETAIWNRALNQAEITSIYNNGYPKDLTILAPISWWRLGEDAYFDGTDFTIPNKISGAPNGTSDNMTATDLVADAPGSYAAGLGSSLALDDRLGDAPLSTANSLSFNMTPENRISYIAGYTPAQVNNVYSMAFDGNNDYVNAGTNLFTDADISSISISCWIKTPVNNSFTGAIVSKDQANSASHGGTAAKNRNFLLQISSGDLFWQTSPNTSGNNFQNESVARTAYSVVDGNWHHIVVTYEAGATSGTAEKKIYIDGELKATTSQASLSNISNNTSVPIEIGRRGDAARYFNGNIDEVAIFDYALSARQIKQDIYNATTSGKTADLNNNSNLTPPVAWYRMGD